MKTWDGINACYQVTDGSLLYFTRWYSADNRCDQIMRFDGSAITAMPFNSPEFDCSDACPYSGALIYGSTKNGVYDLFLFDAVRSLQLTGLCSPQNDLGACFLPAVRVDATADDGR